jgi:hypothetical protein
MAKKEKPLKLITKLLRSRFVETLGWLSIGIYFADFLPPQNFWLKFEF